MIYIPKKIESRIVKNISKFQRVLKLARKKDINESDTIAIILDMLHEIFGYEKYLEITSESAIRGTYCDLAIKLDGKFAYLIEGKAIGIDLKERHIKQAIDYGSNKGIPWVILTNGLIWQVYRIRFEKPINYDLVFTLDFDKITLKSDKDLELLFILCKEAMAKNLREEYFEKTQSVNRFVIGNLLLNDGVVSLVKRELRKLAEGVRIESEEIYDLIKKDVLKRDIVEGEDAENAQRKLKKLFRKSIRQKSKKLQKSKSENVNKNISVSDQLLKEADEEK